MITEAFFFITVTATPALEPLWQWLCAHVSQFNMIVWGCFISQIFGYFIGCIPYILIDLFQPQTSSALKIQSKFPTRSALIKASIEVTVSFIFVVFPLLILAAYVFPLVGISRDGPLPSWYLLIAQIAIFFLIEDYFNYWLHRWLHQPWLYRHVHYMHHKYDAPFAIVAAFAHPIETVLLGIPTLLGPLIVAPHLYTIMLWQIFRMFEAIDIHSGYDLPYSLKSIFPAFAGARHHDYHHYMHSGNFASVFTWCDQLYGTNLGYEQHLAKRSDRTQ